MEEVVSGKKDKILREFEEVCREYFLGRVEREDGALSCVSESVYGFTEFYPAFIDVGVKVLKAGLAPVVELAAREEGEEASLTMTREGVVRVERATVERREFDEFELEPLGLSSVVSVALSRSGACAEREERGIKVTACGWLDAEADYDEGVSRLMGRARARAALRCRLDAEEIRRRVTEALDEAERLAGRLARDLVEDAASKVKRRVEKAEKEVFG